MAKLFMLSCKKATELVEKKSVVGLSLTEYLKLKLHLGMCKACNAYGKQSILMDKFIWKHHEQNKDEVENPELKRRIIEKLL